MSKKKREAKRVEQRARGELLTRRGDEALATFWSQFPSPYESPADEESDRETGVRLRAEAPAEADEPSQPLFEEKEDRSYAFRAWVFAYYAALVRQHDSPEEAARRVRFQLARIWTTDRSEMLRPDALKVAGALIRHLPLEETVGEIPSPYASDEEVERDLDLVDAAVKRYQDREGLPHDAQPPLFVEADDDVTPAPWTEDLRELLVEKYGSEDAAEPYFRFLFAMLAQTAAEEADEGHEGGTVVEEG